MSGNDSGDRVHNFFPQDKFLHGPHHQQTVEGSWPVANNNFLVGGQIGLPNNSAKNVNIQKSVTDRGQGGHALHGQSGLNFTQNSSNFGQNLFQRQQLNSNGYMFGNHVNQTRQDRANMLAVDTIRDQHNLVSKRLSMYELHHGPASQHQTNSLVGSDTTESPVTFNLFENKQQMLHPQSSMIESFQKQQSEFSDMQQFQQQNMWKKMQELQRQHQLYQPDGRQQNAVNSISPFPKQLTGSYPSAMVNFPPRDDLQNSCWGTESGNTNWLQRASSVVQGSPNGFVNSANHGLAQSSSNLGAQEGDQSLYGDTHCGLRGNLTKFSEITVEKPFMEQVPAFANNVPASQYQASVEQTSMQEEPMFSRQGFPSENSYSHPPAQTIPQVNPVKRIASSQEIHLEVAPSQEKTSSEDIASQNEVPLDPTEARILYGSEDNIWSAFGESLDDCGDAGGPFDNFQSGTWSALMQSAVAETSSNDVGQKEALDGLNLKNTTVHSENQTSTHSDRQDTSFHSDMSSPLHLSLHNPDISPMNSNHQNILGVQQLGDKFSCEHGQRQGNSSQREGSNISSTGLLQNSVTDVRPTHQSVSRSGGSETNQVSYRGPWPPAQTGLSDQYGKSSVYNPLEPAPHFVDATIREHENSSLHSQDYELKAGTKGEVGHGGFLFNSCPMPSLSAEVEHVKSFSRNPFVIRGGLTVSNAAAMPNLSTAQFNEASHAMFWRNVNPAIMSYGSGSVGRAHHSDGQENQTVDSSLSSRGKANADTRVMENCKRNDSSNNSYCSDLSHNNFPGGVKENMISNVGDSHSLISEEQKYISHNKFGKTSPLKFQFHPIGTMDEDTPVHFGVKHSSHSLLSQQSTDFEGFNASRRTPKGSLDSENGQLADKKNANDINGTCGNFPGHIQNDTVPYKHVDMCAPDKDAPSSSQNMLELFHKIDQVRGHGLLIPSSPSGGHNVSSELPETENCGSSASLLQQNYTSTSQGFGLQLGPPSHRSTLPSQSFISQGSLQKGRNSHQSQDASDIGVTGPSQLPSSPAVQSFPPPSGRAVRVFNHDRSALPEHVNPDCINKMPGSYLSASSSDCPGSRSQFQYQQMVKESGQLSKKQHVMSNSIQKNDTLNNESQNPQHDDSDLLEGSSNQISVAESQLRGFVPTTSAKDVPVSQAMNDIAQQGTSVEMMSNMRSNVPGQPHLFSSQIRRTSSNALQFHQPNVLESNSFTPHKQGEQESIAGHSSPSVSGSSSMNKSSPVQQDSTGKINMAQRDKCERPQPTSNNFRDGSPSNSVLMQNDLEAFGRSLMPSNSSHQSYSLLHQMRIIKSAETDPNERARKRMKSSGSAEECQQLICKADTLNDKAVGQHDGNNLTPFVGHHPYTSPQMTPSWINQYGGGYMNGQMLPEYDARRGTASKTVEPSFSQGKTFSGDHMSDSNEQVAAAGIGLGQIVNIQQIPIPISAAVEPQYLVLNVTTSKKRDCTRFKLTSWRKEVLQGSRNAQTISMAEVNWAKAANRLPEKIEDEVKFSQDGLSMLKAKRRITLATQLMQQLLSPPKSAILSSEAELNYDGVAYSVSRLALGEACGLLPYPNSDSDKPHPAVSLFSGKDNELEKANDRPISKLVDGFMGRAKKLESDFLRLDKRVSLLDIRSECQDLEKFSVINRFAKFHGRGQTETGNGSSSNGAANALRAYPQRYVTALPAPRNLPDGVHCLSL